VPDVDRMADAMPHPHGDLVATLTIAVGDVVMDQRAVLKVLDRHGEIEAAGSGLAKELARRDRQGSSQSLPAPNDLRRHAGPKRRHVRYALELLSEPVLDLGFGVAEERLQIGIQAFARVAGETR